MEDRHNENRPGIRVEHLQAVSPEQLEAQINARLELGFRYILTPPSMTVDHWWHAWISFNRAELVPEA